MPRHGHHDHDAPEVEPQIDGYVPTPIPNVYSVYVVGNHPTTNPHGVTTSVPDYTPKTWEEKAALVAVIPVDVMETAWDEPYPVGGGHDEEYHFYQSHGFRRPDHENETAPLPNEPEGGFFAAHGYRRD